MRLRTLFACAVLVSLAAVPVQAPAKPFQPVSIYAAKGKLTVIPKSPDENAGSWVIAGSVKMVSLTDTQAPRTGTLTGGGKLGPASIPTSPCQLTATTGRFTIDWDGAKSTGDFVHAMLHPAHAFLVRFTSGYRAGGYGLLVIRHRPNDRFTGYLTIP